MQTCAGLLDESAVGLRYRAQTTALCRIIVVLLSVASLREKVHLDGHGYDHWAAALLADLAEPNLSSGNRSCYDIAD